MAIEQLRQVYQTQPFQPFIIHLADGRSFNVPHREFISHSPKGRTLIVYGEEDDAFDILDFLLVTGIEVHPANPTRQNGESNS